MKVYKTSCNQCLLSKNAIVDSERKSEILKDCIENQEFFICHKSSINGGNICCRNFYDKLGHVSQSVRIAERLNIVSFVEHTSDENEQ